MKVICKCCHKSFDYDMYMGLCPKCGRVYRRGHGHYSAVEKDMLGDFHVHADEGGLNRGIHGVVYNQGSVSEKQVLNTASKATVNTDVDSVPQTAYRSAPTNYQTSNFVGGSASAINAAKTNAISNVADIENKIQDFRANNGQSYYGANHRTRMNQGVNPKKNNSGGIVFAIVVIIILINLFLTMFD